MWKSIKRYHFFYLRKGFYGFLGKASLKFAALVALIVVALWAFEAFTPGITYYFAKFSEVVAKETVIVVFFVSEFILGLIPPDLFIIWAEQFSSPYWVVGLLGLLSYIAGILAYFVGLMIIKSEKIAAYVDRKFGKHFKMIKSWGGFIIVIAGLFPLPFSTTCLAAGIIRYPTVPLLILGLFRIIRFYIYAFFIFKMV